MSQKSMFGISKRKRSLNVHFSSNDHKWTTPDDLFNELNGEYNFTLDPCCEKDTAKCEKYFTKEDNGLLQDWSNDTVFMNPPYGRDIYKWMQKAYSEALKGAVVVCLVPSRTDTKWWHNFSMKGEIIFIKGRLKFGNAKHNAPFPSAIVIFNNNKK